MSQKDAFQIENGVLIKYNDAKAETDTVIIPEGVTAIAKEAFQNCYDIRKVVIPDSVTIIGESAFNSCYNLESVVLPKRLKTIGEECFFDCVSLTKIELPDTVEEIKDAAFCNCNIELKRIPASLKYIGEYAFGSYSLPDFSNTIKNVSLPAGLKRIGKGTFQGCLVTSVVLPDGLEEIDDDAFCFSSLSHVKMPTSLKRIGKDAFADSHELEWVEFNDGLAVIDDGAFANCALSKALLKSGLNRIGARGFDGCKKLNYVVFPTSLREIGEDAFRGCPLYKTKIPRKMKEFAQKAAIADRSESIIGEIVEYLSRWSIKHIIGNLLTRSVSGSEGGYFIGVGKSEVSISLFDHYATSLENDDLYYTYWFSKEEFLQIMDILRTEQVCRTNDKERINIINENYDKLADRLLRLP